MPDKPLKHYTYYAVAPTGQAQQLPIQGFGPTPPTPGQVEAMYQAMVQQAAKQGQFNVPRPTHLSATVLHELPKPKEAPNGRLLVVPRSGALPPERRA